MLQGTGQDDDGDPERKKTRRAWRDVLLSLLGAGIFGVILVSYILKGVTIPQPTILLPETDAGARWPDDLQLGQRVAGRFVAALHTGDLDAAYAQMAGPYREGASLKIFRAAWTTSPLLASPQSIKLSRAHSATMQLPGGGGFVRGATFTANGMLLVGSGALEVSFTFLREAEDAHVIAVFVGGIPIVQGLGQQPAR